MNRRFEIRQSTVIAVLLAIIAIAIAAAALLIYFEIAWQAVLTVSLYVLGIAGLLSFLAVFLLGLSRIIAAINRNRRPPSRVDNQSGEAPDSIGEKIFDVMDSLSKLSATANQIALITKTQFIASKRSKASYNQADNSTSYLQQEKQLDTIIYDMKTLSQNLENVLSKVIEKEQQQLYSTQGESDRRTNKTQKQPGDNPGHTTQQTGFPERNYREKTQTTSENYDRDKFDSSLEGFNKTALKLVVEDYAQATAQPEKQQYFMEKYSPTTLDTQNANARLQNPELKPIFAKSPQGSFMAIKTDHEGLFLIVPKFNFVLKDTNYNPGAVNEVFDCKNYYPGYKYSQIKLVRPAVFNHKGDNWSIKVAGILLLGQGE